MKTTFLKFAAVILGSSILTSNAALHLKEEMSFPVSQSHLGDFASPVSTYNGNIYTTWIGTDGSTMVAKKTPAGVITSYKIPDSVAPADTYHSAASMGIDKDGYIHITSGMHYGDWNYWVSTSPENINSFVFLGDNVDRRPPCHDASYATFVTDRKGTLFLSYRVRLGHSTYWKGGILAGCVARYDTATKRWTALGGTNWHFSGINAGKEGVKDKVLVWTNKDCSYDAYEGYKPNLQFDKNNRLHFSALGQAWGNLGSGPGETTGTHAYYAYSDDEGDTWYRANGTKIDALPMTKDTADNAAAKPWPSGITSIWNQCLVGFGSDLKPIVSFSYMGTPGKTWARWTGTSWSKIKNPVDFLGHFVTDDAGVISAASGGKFMFSKDNGKTWTTFGVSVGNNTSVCFDYRHLYTTRQIRFQSMHIDTGLTTGWVKVFTIYNDAAAAPIIQNESSSSGVVGKSFSLQIAAINKPTSYDAINLPTGLSVNHSTGLVSGTPTIAGTFSITLSAKNASGSDTQTLTLKILSDGVTPTNVAPKLSSNPQSITVFAGKSATFSVTATGTPTPTYQWMKNGIAILGATSKTYTIPATSLSDNGALFSVKVSNTAGSVTSTSAKLTVNPETYDVTITSLELINADKGTVIQTLNNNAVLNLATLPTKNLAIRANPSSSSVGSIVFNLTGTQTRTQIESIAPYALFGGTSTIYNPWTPAVGGFTLSVIPHSLTQGGGIAGKTFTVNFSVMDLKAPVITSSSTASGTEKAAFSYQITAANSPAGYDASGLPSGLTINTSTGVISGVPTIPGKFSVTLSAKNAAGSGSETLVLTIAPAPVVQEVLSFTLVNADNNTDIKTINNGETISLAGLPSQHLNIRANTSISPIESVKFDLSGPVARVSIENNAPYALFRNSGNDYFTSNMPVGSYTLKATPFAADDAMGAAGVSKSISFTITK